MMEWPENYDQNNYRYNRNRRSIFSHFARRTLFRRFRLALTIVSMLLSSLLTYYISFCVLQERIATSPYQIVSKSSRLVSFNINTMPTESASIKPPNMCNPSPYLLIIVCSPVENLHNRMTIRKTWASWQNYKTLNSSVEVVFLLGQSEDDIFTSSVKTEDALYKDIIQENFIDTYGNMTIKTIALLKWATLKCPTFTYLMKTNDDMFVNLPLLLMKLQAKHVANNTLIGYRVHTIILPQTLDHKLPSERASIRITPYLSGTGYVMSYDVATKLFNVSLVLPMRMSEDSHITGTCAKHANLTPVHYLGFNEKSIKLRDEKLRNAITVHCIDVQDMYNIWSRLMN